MLDIGFWELAFLAVLCLVVVGPDRLPGLMRSLGSLMGRAKLAVMRLKAELDRVDDERKP
jgi:sec-independent protein translocase protein TatB